jgi:hypothetical protein
MRVIVFMITVKNRMGGKAAQIQRCEKKIFANITLLTDDNAAHSFPAV